MSRNTTSHERAAEAGQHEDPHVHESAVDPRANLKAAGLRATKPRLAVLEWLREQPHSTAEQVAAGVRAQLGTVSTQAIYDVLHACTHAGLLRRIEPAGHPARFETRTADNHHHLVCRVCGRTEDVDCVFGSAPCLTPSTSAGFQVDEAEVVFWGCCPSCQQSPAENNTPRNSAATNSAVKNNEEDGS